MSREGQPDAVIEALLEQLRNRPSTHMVELNGLLRGLLRIADQLDQTSQAPILKFVIDLLLQAGVGSWQPIYLPVNNLSFYVDHNCVSNHQ